MKSICLVLCLAALLGGCQVTSMEGEYMDVEVKMKNKDSNSNHGTFCPPGQAKKGKC